MDKQKKICFCFTPRQLIGTVLLAVSVVNLIIVGAAFKASTLTAAPPTTVINTIDPITMTFSIVTATEGTMFSVEPTGTPTPTATFTPTDTPTSTLTSTPTSTDTPSPTATVCTPYYHWPIYIVRPGDDLWSLALAIASSVNELMRANCLKDTRIYFDQPLYVPRLPIFTPTYTPTFTPTPTATYTPTSTPEIFRNPSVCLYSLRQTNLYLSFSVTLSAVQNISSITAFSGSDVQVTLTDLGGGLYNGAFAGSGGYVAGADVSYYFIVKDSLGQNIPSATYYTRLGSCLT